MIAWICIIGLAVASWTPGQEMIRTGFSTRLEHTVAYLIAGIAAIIAPRKPSTGRSGKDQDMTDQPTKPSAKKLKSSRQIYRQLSSIVALTTVAPRPGEIAQ